MFHFLFILLLIIIIVPLLFVFGVALKFWNMLTGGNDYTKNSFNRSSHEYSSKQNRAGNRRNTSNNSRTSSSNYDEKKIFKEGEGEYVDFEEVD